MMGWGYDMPGWGGHWLGGVVVLLFWVLVLVGVVALVRAVLSRGGATPAAPESPLEILKRRYAKGEIDKAEYDDKRKDLLG